MKQGRALKKIIMLIAFFIVSEAAYAQLPPSAEVLPSGFKVDTERNMGGSMMIISAKKPNENFPKSHMDQGIGFEISWTKNPTAEKLLDMLAKQPEDLARRNPGSVTREEPCGRKSYSGGVLSCRKVITPWVGGGSAPDLVTWRISWVGKGTDGLVTISINNFYGYKETAINWIDKIIPKITQKK